MRIDAKIAGNDTCFHLDCELARGQGFDSPSTIKFAQSLCQSINRQMHVLEGLFQQQIAEDDKKARKQKIVARSINQDRFAHVYIDIYMERQKGKPLAVCKIFTDEANSDLRTKNILSEIAHFCYKLVWFLRSKKPPKGMECLRSMPIIRNYFDPYKNTHECYVDENGDLRERLKSERTKK